MPASFLFYDLETFGADPRRTRIAQFAAIRTDAELREIQNANLFHLCPSETEGFGHYIVEALSVGAIVLTLRERRLAVKRQDIGEQVGRRPADAIEVVKAPVGQGVAEGGGVR